MAVKMFPEMFYDIVGGMKVFLSVKYHTDMSNRGHIERLLGMLKDLRYETFCVVRDLETWGETAVDERELMRITFERIRASHLVLADLSEKGVGIGIEAGYAAARGIRVVVIAPEGCDISTTLKGIAEACFTYRNEADLRQFLTGLAR